MQECLRDPVSNRLAAEPSPYLRQHADNPVDWWPWSDEAFAEAQRRDVPVFLSIGYATCHWCHVMAHESFEDAGVALLMNEAFVNVKVDREERPDIDDVYMAVCQGMTGSGGWPLTVLLTPDKKPFLAGTYFPKLTRHGRIGMMELIPKIQEAWTDKRKELLHQAEHVLQEVGQTATSGRVDADTKPLGPETLQMCTLRLRERFDATHGGFGGAPKFPSPHNLLFLLRRHHRTGDEQALAMVTKTLHAMADGGIHDHLGGGFHRYATDPHWLLPHFEKMLYDQAMLAMAYTEAFQVTGEARFATVTRDILDYILRDLRDPAGGFRCAEDADSEGEEGRFYLWTRHEVLTILGKAEGDIFCEAYGVTEEGNFHDEATHQRTGANILHLATPLEALAKRRAIPQAALKAGLAASRTKLLAVRVRRERPLLDDKVLTDWNGLAIAAFAKAATALAEPKYMIAAQEATEFLFREMLTPRGRLRHRFHGGTSPAAPAKDDIAFLDDHAFLLWGLLELYDATFDVRHLEWALRIATDLERHFEDRPGGYFQAPDDGEQLGVRRKEAYDGALPSGNSVAAWCLLRLSHLTGDTKVRDQADAVLHVFSATVASHPYAYGMMCVALDFALGPTQELVVAGAGKPALEMLDVAGAGFHPGLVRLHQSEGLAQVAAWTAEHKALGGKATAYLCQGHACHAPVHDAQALAGLLGHER